MCKPSQIYVFDEVDSALDKENSKKLSFLIKEMSKNSQFIVVSHNDSLIVNADAAIGVVKSNEESKAVGVEIASMVKKGSTRKA
ncbi:AAA family ATPase [Candidatus Marsarchaeota archaeon]|nr:AAA family ATPase [Candidatus Marsarchaeota archaeon]